MEAEVKALLTLDATGFNNSMSNIVKKVENFSTTISSVGKNSESFVSGLRHIRDEMNILNEAFTKLEVSTQKAMDFKRIADGMQKLVDTARQLRDDNISLEGTYQALENVVNVFGDMLSRQEITLKGNVQLTRQLAEANRELSSSAMGYNEIIESASKFSTATNNTATSLNNFQSKLSSFSTSLNTTFQRVASGSTSFDRLRSELNTTSNAFSNFISRMVSYGSNITTISTGTNNIKTSLSTLNTTLNSTKSSLNTSTAELERFSFKTNETATQTSKLTTTVKLLYDQMTGLASVGLGNGYATFLNDIAKINAEVSKAQLTFSKGLNNGAEQLMHGFNDYASQSMNKMTSTSRGLNSTLSGLRSMVSMVGSMFLYSFAHNMMVSVSNTVKAKSEMMSYLHTMGMTQNQINSFNNALDQTAERFQRINKYNIGETVANIGLEFDLSAKEMEKAMSVTSMITSEYLRAGRNADEAALAVKDIMQGQFQRLSRETGVKGETLKEFGWSGDENDVLGLMDALEKAAKSRHWDTFAEKANSLNDVVLITQNRLSEWATDVTENLTPMITQGFNLIVAGVTGFTGVLGQIGEALHLPDWSGTAVMVTGLALALGGLVTSTITARTGLGLLGIAHQGLGQSIIATIFNIDKEALANQKATTIAMGKLLFQ